MSIRLIAAVNRRRVRTAHGRLGTLVKFEPSTNRCTIRLAGGRKSTIDANAVELLDQSLVILDTVEIAAIELLASTVEQRFNLDGRPDLAEAIRRLDAAVERSTPARPAVG
jgi:hypothetical protein